MDKNKMLLTLFSASVVVTWVVGYLLVRTSYGSDPDTGLYSLLYYTLIAGLLLFTCTSPVFVWTVMGWYQKSAVEQDKEANE